MCGLGASSKALENRLSVPFVSFHQFLEERFSHYCKQNEKYHSKHGKDVRVKVLVFCEKKRKKKKEKKKNRENRFKISWLEYSGGRNLTRFLHLDQTLPLKRTSDGLNCVQPMGC